MEILGDLYKTASRIMNEIGSYALWFYIVYLNCDIYLITNSQYFYFTIIYSIEYLSRSILHYTIFYLNIIIVTKHIKTENIP